MIMSLDSVPKTPIGKDSWDGYGLERRELMTHIAARGINDVSFLTGDIHTFFAGEVGLDGRGPERHATEFVGGSITSLGIPETLEATTGAPPAGRDALALVGRNLLVTNPHLRYLDEKNRGYGIVEATQQELRVQFKAVDAMQRSSAARTIGSFRVPSGSPRVEVV
jgi:phosphodiesterase/alkaline phosphatase D-like protein